MSMMVNKLLDMFVGTTHHSKTQNDQALLAISHLKVINNFLLLISASPISCMAFKVFNDPAAAHSYHELCTPALCSGRQLPVMAEQTFITKTNFNI